LGQSILVVLCAGSILLMAHTPRHQRLLLAPLPMSASNNLRKWFLSPTGQLNLGIITEGRFTNVLIIPSSWGFPNGPVRHQGVFPSFPFCVSVAASQKKPVLALRKRKKHFLWDETKIVLCGIPLHPKGHTRVRYGLVPTNYAMLQAESSSFDLKVMQPRM
jgi:hypothetical protein